jgi:hypothetical protein
LNTGSSAFTNTAPSGFSSWDANRTIYVGSAPRLIQKANAALGQNADVVIATASTGDSQGGVWQTLSGNSSSATDDGAWEFVVDCDNTNIVAQSPSFINVDDWS